MSIPHRCPVCEGRGEVGKRMAQVGSVVVSDKPLRFRCHACHGSGIVWDQTFILNPVPQVTPWQPIGPTWGGDVTIHNLPHITHDCPGIVNPNPKFVPGPDGVLTPQVPLVGGCINTSGAEDGSR